MHSSDCQKLEQSLRMSSGSIALYIRFTFLFAFMPKLCPVPCAIYDCFVLDQDLQFGVMQSTKASIMYWHPNDTSFMHYFYRASFSLFFLSCPTNRVLSLQAVMHRTR